MEINNLKESLKKVRDGSQKRNFSQSFELIVNVKNIDLKKNENQLDFYVPLHFSKGKVPKICALIGPELKDEAKANCDHLILSDDFEKFTKKAELKKLAMSYDYFIAQANIMPKVATSFGKVFGPKGKMPNPKAGCVVPPKANLKPLADKLKKTVRVKMKTEKIIMVPVGAESMKDDEVADNILTLYNQIIHHLPNEENNVRSIFLKLTMGNSFRIDEKGNAQLVERKEEKPAKPKGPPSNKEAKKESKEQNGMKEEEKNGS